MHADLVCASRERTDAQQRSRGKTLQNRILRARRLPVRRNGALRRRTNVPSDGEIDRAGIVRELAAREREIFPPEGVRVEHPAQKIVDIRAFCDDHKPRGAAVEPAHRVERRVSAPERSKGVCNRTPLPPGRAVHRHIRAFIEHGDVLVLIDEGKRRGDGQRLVHRALVADLDAKHVAGAEPRIGKNALAVSHESGFAQLDPGDQSLGHMQPGAEQVLYRAAVPRFVHRERQCAHTPIFLRSAVKFPFPFRSGYDMMNTVHRFSAECSDGKDVLYDLSALRIYHSIFDGSLSLFLFGDERQF